MSYTVKKLSALSGVSVRTLHFYDEIGLLEPARYGENGYRYYEQEQLLLLQQILFFKELGLPLAEIQRIISDPKFDKAKALKAHRKVLEKNINKTRVLIETIDRTLASLEKGKPMKEKEMYLGFDRAKQEEYEKYIIEKGGATAKKLVEESKANTKGWKKDDYDKVKNEFDSLDKDLTAAMEKKLKADADVVQAIVKRHYKLINRFYKPSKEIYVGLGQLYNEHPDFRKRYDARHPRLAEFWAEAIRVFAEKELA